MRRLSSRERFPARRAGLVVPAFFPLLLAVAAQSVAAQVKPPPQPIGPIRSAPPAITGDLVVSGVTIRKVKAPYTIVADVQLRNAGAAPITLPSGSVLVRGDAAQAGGIAFPPLPATSDFTLAAGQVGTLSVAVDACAVGKPGAVTFRVDPDNRAREANEENNSLTVQAVASYADGDLAPPWLRLESSTGATSQNTGPGAGIPAGYPANLVVPLGVQSPAELLWCPGVVLLREIQSPLSGKYGLRELRNDTGTPKLLWGGSLATLVMAYAPGDLTPGTYTWKVQVDPDGKIRETNPANNTITATVLVR